MCFLLLNVLQLLEIIGLFICDFVKCEFFGPLDLLYQKLGKPVNLQKFKLYPDSIRRLLMRILGIVGGDLDVPKISILISRMFLTKNCWQVIKTIFMLSKKSEKFRYGHMASN